MIPLVLITGFLGSGKTTLLRLLVEQTRARRCVCIVNEFSSVDIDGQQIDLPPGRLVSIPGGSIFCRCLAGEFIRVLQQASGAACPRPSLPAVGAPAAAPPIEDPPVASEPPDGVLIEASGMADPKVIARMLAETRLDRTYELRRIITVVEPGSFLKLVHTLPNIIAQVEASDLVLINKTDLYDADVIQACRNAVLELNPDAEVVHTQHCRTGIDVFATRSDRAHAQVDESGEGRSSDHERPGGDHARRSLRGGLEAEYALCADPNFQTRTFAFDRPVDGDKLLAALQALQPHIYRAKGFVPTPAGRVYVDVSVAGITCRAAHEPDNGNDLVIISAPDRHDCIDEFARHVELRPGPNVLG